MEYLASYAISQNKSALTPVMLLNFADLFDQVFSVPIYFKRMRHSSFSDYEGSRPMPAARQAPKIALGMTTIAWRRPCE